MNSMLDIIRKLKLKLDRKALEKLYINYIRPLLGCADII